jgi:hypothetical protein
MGIGHLEPRDEQDVGPDGLIPALRRSRGIVHGYLEDVIHAKDERRDTMTSLTMSAYCNERQRPRYLNGE